MTAKKTPPLPALNLPSMSDVLRWLPDSSQYFGLSMCVSRYGRMVRIMPYDVKNTIMFRSTASQRSHILRSMRFCMVGSAFMVVYLVVTVRS